MLKRVEICIVQFIKHMPLCNRNQLLNLGWNIRASEILGRALESKYRRLELSSCHMCASMPTGLPCQLKKNRETSGVI
jgi:hypothetical protein